MLTDEIVKVIFNQLANIIVGIGAGYIVLVVKNVYKDINKIGDIARESKKEISELEEKVVCLKITVSRIEQQIKDNRDLCDHRHEKK